MVNQRGLVLAVGVLCEPDDDDDDLQRWRRKMKGQKVMRH
jgi:hypothetical protein